MATQQFFLGEWHVDPTSNTLKLGKNKRTIEPKAMDVLLLLCQHAGEVVSGDDIISQCWPGTPIGDNPVHKIIAQLRKALNDKASNPTFIETIRKRGYKIIADVQLIVGEQHRAAETNWTDQSPFPGLNAFNQQHSPVYYGRNAAVNNLLNQLAEQCARKRPFTLIIGPSGSGKSSLVHAGLLPRLMNKKGVNGIHAIDYISIDFSDIRPTSIVEELASCMLDWEINNTPLFDGESPNSLALKLKTDPQQIIDTAKTQMAKASEHPAIVHSCFVIVLDRLEAYLTTSEVNQNQRNATFELLETLSKSGLFMVLLVCRNDFYHQLAAYPTLMKFKERGAHFDLAPPTPGELSQMIRLPAITAGLTWQLDDATDVPLDDIILTDAAAEPNCLPLLQYTLQELYLQRKDSTLQIKTYRKLGGIEGAIGQKAEQLYQDMPTHTKNALNHVLPLVITLGNNNNRLTSRTALWSELTNNDEKKFVELMVQHRLFVSYLYQDKACFKVAHEAVLRSWPRVQIWLQEHQNALVIKERLEQQTKQWLLDNRSNAFLLTEGKPLTDALILQNDHHITLSDEELSLIKASQNLVRRKRIIRGITFTALAGLSIISFTAMLQSQQSLEFAEQKRLEAENLMGFMIGEFADKLRSVKRMDLLEGISQKAIQYVEQAQNNTHNGLFTIRSPKPSFELRFQHALSLQAVAEVRFYRDDTETAKQAYEEANVKLNELLAEQPDNFELLKAAGANAFWLGNIAFWADNLRLANKEFKRYLNFSERMLKLAPNDEEALLEVSYATNSLGSLAFRRLEFDKALAYFESSLTYKRQILEKSASPSAVAAVADTYSWIASTLINKGNINQALLTFNKAEHLLNTQLSDTPGNADTIETLIFIKTNIAQSIGFTNDVFISIEKLEDAKRQVLTILAQDPNNSSWKANYLKIQTLLSYYQSQIERFSSQNKTPPNITVDEFLNSDTRTATIINAVHYFQNRGEWNNSLKLLTLLNSAHSLPDKIQSNIQTNVNNIKTLLRHVQYQIASIRQAHHDNGHDVNAMRKKCESLFELSNKVIHKSKHPLFLQAHVFSGYCLGKKDAVASQRRQLTSMEVPMPAYFTIVNKEYKNDSSNTTKL